MGLEYSTLVLFSFAALALTASPGPDMLLVAARSAAEGRIAGFATWAGIAVGTYCHAVAAAFGLSQLFLAVPIAYDLVRITGAVYLMYLAWRAFTAPDGTPVQVAASGAGLSARTVFYQGLVTNLLNPKMAIFVLALFPQFLDLEGGPVAMQIMIMATVINLFGFIINGAVILAASRAGALLSQNTKVKQVSQYVLGTVFAALAARLAFESQQ